MRSEVDFESGYFTSFDGARIYYEVRGTGAPLILCYGIVCTMNHWNHQIRHFSKMARVITFDYRGHHHTPRPQNMAHLNIDSLALDVAALCSHLNITKASFWGHSFGAQVLVRAHDMHPELFENLVLINGFASNPLSEAVGSEVLANLLPHLKDGYDRMPSTLSYLWKTAVNNPITMRLSALAGGFNLSLTSIKDAEIYVRGVANIELEVFLTLFSQMLRYDGRSTLERIRVPALILGGSMDRVTPLSHQRRLHESIQNSEFMIVPFGTHCSQLDMPDLVNLSAENFLRRINYLA
jgi:pimeloyl-ACP methyl ester carboxylesterase